MKRLFILLAGVCALSPITSADNPVARQESVVTDGNTRFTVLTPEMVRIEYSPKGSFEDKATFAIVNRELPPVSYTTNDEGDYLTLTTPKLKLRYRKGSDPKTEPASPDNLSIQMTGPDGRQIMWYPGLRDSLNLKGTTRTLDGNDGDAYRDRLENGVISRSGWAVIDDSPSVIRPDGSRSLAFTGAEDIPWVTERSDSTALDIYFMGYGHDYKKALKDFTRVAGRIPLPPDYVFGYWYSKYDNYSSQDFRDILSNFREKDINADVLILDMDWHYNGEKEVSGGRGGWTGWTWNTNLIPDPEELLADIHADGIHVALNLHPADGVAWDEDFYKEISEDMGMDPKSKERVPWQLENRDFARTFFNHIIRAREKQGVDFWWLDWQQNLTNPRMSGLGETFWCNHVFFNEMKHSRPDHRPVIFHRWGGLGSHRYQIGFSGDTFINYPTLAFLPYFTATASNVGYGYWGHDIGGHMPNYHPVNDPELLLRWLQSGVFTPIFRTHATKGTYIERRLWKYDNFPLMNDAIRLRYSLFPYLYTMARESYDTGVGICRPMYYEHPEEEAAYSHEGQYYFGNDILVAPVTAPSENGLSKKEVWFPEGTAWWSAAHNRLVKGGSSEVLEYALDQIPYFYRRGSVIFRNPPEVKRVTERPDHLEMTVIAGENGGGRLYEDEGDSQNYATQYAVTEVEQKYEPDRTVLTIGARKGSYPDMPLERRYTLRVYNSDGPAEATLNGSKVESKYDAATHCMTVETPLMPCDRPYTVVLSRK